MNHSKLTYTHGFSEAHRDSAALLYESAFGSKFSVAVRSRDRRIDLLSRTFCPNFAFCAMHDNELVGLAGYHSALGSLTGGMNYGELLSQLGLMRGNWAAAIFCLYERTPMADELLMDGIAVDERMRGRGVGSHLLEMLKEYASQEQFRSIRLDVIDTNPRARKLYERSGFVVTKTERFTYLRWLLGFGSASTMEFRISG